MPPVLIQRPTYLSGAPVPDNVTEACKTVVDKAAPVTGIVLGSVVGAAAFYLVPKIFDWAIDKYNGMGEESPNVELNVEPRDD